MSSTMSTEQQIQNLSPAVSFSLPSPPPLSSSRFTVTPTNSTNSTTAPNSSVSSNVFTFPGGSPQVIMSRNIISSSPFSPGSTYFNNPLYSPSIDGDGVSPSVGVSPLKALDARALEVEALQIPVPPPPLSSPPSTSSSAQQPNLDGLLTHQESLFDIQLEGCMNLATESQLPQETAILGGEKRGDDKITFPTKVTAAASVATEWWDKARTSGEKDLDQGFSEWPLQLLKVMVYNLTFILILLLAVSSKAVTLLMTSMVVADRSMTLCITRSTQNASNVQPYILINEGEQEEDNDVQAKGNYTLRYGPDSVHRIAWLWALLFAAAAPYVFAFGRSVRICYFRSSRVPTRATTVTVFFAETLHIIGLAMLLLLVLPNFDVVRGAMMLSSVCTVPSLLGLLVVEPSSSTETSSNEMENSKKKIKFKNVGKKPNRFGFTNHRLFAAFIALLQLFSLAAWTLVDSIDEISTSGPGGSGRYHLVPVALLLVSFEWWENFVVAGQMGRTALGRTLDRVRQELNDGGNGRYYLGLFLYPWKVFLLFLLAFIHQWAEHGWPVAWSMFSHFTEGFRRKELFFTSEQYNGSGRPIWGPFTLEEGLYQMEVEPMAPVYFLLSHICASYACYWLAKYSCQIWIQKISFAIPITLSVPVTVALLWEFTDLSQTDKCSLVHRFPLFQYVFWRDHLEHTFTFPLSKNGDWLYIGVAAIWYLGTQFPNSMHIWRLTNERLATSDAIFVSPKYNAVLLDQSLALNRRRTKVVLAIGDSSSSSAAAEELSSGASTVDDSASTIIGGGDHSSSSFSSPPYDDHQNRRRETLAQIENAEFRAAQLKQEEDWAREWADICESHGLDRDGIDPKPNPASDDIVRIYACATMWHEDKREMLQMLKAVMRLDFDQAAKRIARTQFSSEGEGTSVSGSSSSSSTTTEDHEYYELEVNIFFDAAFEQKLDPSTGQPSQIEGDRVINRFVETLIELMNEAATAVLGTRPKSRKSLRKRGLVDWPTIVPTPFGGKLIWKLPGGNRLIAHLKDKALIRDRKRWSQVMYMYYLLAHRLAARRDLNDRRKRKIANNTFILALDGDINFQPSAVHLVVDLMKKNSKLGAACGRIHPIGSGLMVWYQKFEYSIGHWFQKATEHVFGCVLCSPGCFSLFRARALMDDSVMHRYTTKSTEALHYVQFDQGEDRWLCTLLLQRGWRIEYCAASDSFTHAPEGFGEFYTQRRRWAPSTMANIIDLLSHYRQTVQVNENVSLLFIIYQGFLMLGSLLSPATITLMVVTAMNTAMSMSLPFSIYSNLIVIAAFTFVCTYFGNDRNSLKITFASVLSTVYALLMLAVLIGTAIEMVKDGLFSPNSLFFTAMIASFILAAILHPHEFACVFLFPIYMLLIPSMYLVLTIYAITNLHVVSWGTREVKEKEGGGNLNEDQEVLEEQENVAKKRTTFNARGLLQYIDPRRQKSVSGLFSCLCCSVGVAGKGVGNGMLNCSCCSGVNTLNGNGESSNESSVQSKAFEEIREEITSLKTVVNQITSQLPSISISLPTTTGTGSAAGAFNFGLSSQMPNAQTLGIRNGQSVNHKMVEFQVEEEEEEEEKTPEEEEEEEEEVVSETTAQPSVENSENNNSSQAANQMSSSNVPLWILNHPQLRTFRRRPLAPREHLFWVGLIDRYLAPMKPDKAEQARIEAELLTLRNKALFAMGFLNVLVVLAFFILQSHTDLVLKIPINSDVVDEVTGKPKLIEMHPIGFWLVLFFGSLLAIQCVGMVLHRLATLTQLLAYTTVNFWTKKEEKLASLVKRIIYSNASRQQSSGMLEQEEAEVEEEDGSYQSEPSTIREDIEERRGDDEGGDGRGGGDLGGGGEIGGDTPGELSLRASEEDRRRRRLHHHRRRRSTHIQIDELFKYEVNQILSREPSVLSDHRSHNNVLHRLSTTRRPISLPHQALPQRTNSVPTVRGPIEEVVEVEEGGSGERSSKVLENSISSPLATTSTTPSLNPLHRSSKTLVGRFTGSLRHLRARAGSWLSQQQQSQGQNQSQSHRQSQSHHHSQSSEA